jgi:hemoglobin
MMPHEFKSLYDLIGEDGFTRLVSVFYRRVADDPVLRPVYPEEDLSGAERRLRMFLIQYFGGPTSYSDERGHPRLRMRHAPFVIGERERDAWLQNMLAAMDEVKIPEPAYSAMKDYFEKGASFMMNATPFGRMLRESNTT